jgi:N-acetylglucosamine malate deacetylase 1
MNKTILVIAAHPDDEVLGCGGSIAKWSQEGNKVHILIMAEGATSRNKQRDRNASKKDLSLLAQSANEAGQILGAETVTLLDYPDNRMDSVDLLDVVKSIEHYIEKVKPEVIATHHFGDLNVDHQIVHTAVMTASRPQPGHIVKRILCFETQSSTEWQSPINKQAFVPNWFEDISSTLEIKIKALHAYKSEMRAFPHSRSIEALESLAKWRGSIVGKNAAETFMLMREIV